MAPWWVENPARWQQELLALDSAGLEYTVADSGDGARRVHIRSVINGQAVQLLGIYPREFPYFPPVVELRGVQLARHHTAGNARLCLLGDDGNQWHPATDTLAWLVTAQLADVLRSQPGPDKDASVESQQAEPITAYLDYEPDSFVGIPELPPALPTHGTFRLAVESLGPLRGTVLEWCGPDATVLAQSDLRAASAYPASTPVVTGRWLRMRRRVDTHDARDIFGDIVAAEPSMGTPHWQVLGAGQAPRVDLIAVVFPDEITGGVVGTNVILLAKLQLRKQDGSRDRVQQKLIRSEQESRRLYGLRDPVVASLSGTRVAIVGMGSIGSPVARFLAQSGVGHLNLIDQDILEAGNAVRWEAGRSLAGKFKAHAMAELLSAFFPLTKVAGCVAKVGDAGNVGTPVEQQLEQLLFEDVDCIVDASAATNVSHYLSSEAWARGIAYVWLYATNGAWGGAVAVARRGDDSPCWMCYQHYLDDGTIQLPPAAPETDTVHPPRCLDPTFTGSQVDLVEVSLAAVRLTISQLRERSTNAPATAWNFATLSFRGAGEPPLPRWTSYRLTQHAACPYHPAPLAPS